MVDLLIRIDIFNFTSASLASYLNYIRTYRKQTLWNYLETLDYLLIIWTLEQLAYVHGNKFNFIYLTSYNSYENVSVVRTKWHKINSAFANFTSQFYFLTYHILYMLVCWFPPPLFWSITLCSFWFLPQFKAVAQCIWCNKLTIIYEKG